MSITDIIIDVIIRSAVLEDLAGIQAVCAIALDLEPDATDLPKLLQASPERLAIVVQSADEVVGVCYGSIGKPVPDGRRGHVELLAVAPAARGRGAGRRLLGEMEARLRERGVTEFILGANPPVYVWPGIDVRYTAMTCLADTAGYERYQDAVDMAVDLRAVDLDTSADERRLARAGVTVRRAARAEAGLVADWLRAGPWGQSTWPDEAASALAREPARCHVGCRDGSYIGFACYGAVRSGWFGPMGTLASERRLGVGSVLLKRCLADMRGSGLPTARIGWVGPVRFYAKTICARIERVYWLYRKAM
jgi:mycothiol synthase